MLRKKRGFTLVELMVSAGIFTTMIALLTGVVVAQTKFGISIGNYSDMNVGSMKLLSQFEKDMRMAKTVDTMKGAEVQVRIVEDVDWSVLLDSTKGSDWTAATTNKTAVVRYYFADGKLMRDYTPTDGKTVTTTLLTGLDTGGFAYFNNDDDIATTTPSVKKIMVSGTMKRSFVGTSNTDYLVSAVVVMRSKSGTRAS